MLLDHSTELSTTSTAVTRKLALHSLYVLLSSMNVYMSLFMPFLFQLVGFLLKIVLDVHLPTEALQICINDFVGSS